MSNRFFFVVIFNDGKLISFANKSKLKKKILQRISLIREIDICKSNPRPHSLTHVCIKNVMSHEGSNENVKLSIANLKMLK